MVFGMAEFGYAQLREIGRLPLGLLASSAWQLAAGQMESACSNGVCWTVPVGIIITVLLAVAFRNWAGRTRRGSRGVSEDSYE